MKYLLFIVLFFVSTHKIYCDKLDDLDDHLDDRDDLFDDHLDDHLEDLDDHLDDDDDDDRHKSALQRQLLLEIEKFLPNEEPAKIFVPIQREPQNIEKSLGFGLPLVPEVHQEPPQIFTAPQQSFQTQPQPQPAFVPQAQPQPIQQTFGVPLEQTQSVPQEPVQVNQQNSFSSFPQDELTVVNPPVVQELQVLIDTDDDDVDIPGAVDPAPFGLSPAHDDYDDIQNNLIGGQGRQLNTGRKTSPSFNPFEGDYPRYDIVPRTSFSCGDQELGGYYADLEAECQVFHICLGGGLMGSFLCPNGTLFHQELFVCDWWFNVDCSLAPQSYRLNARIGADYDDSVEELS